MTPTLTVPAGRRCFFGSAAPGCHVGVLRRRARSARCVPGRAAAAGAPRQAGKRPRCHFGCLPPRVIRPWGGGQLSDDPGAYGLRVAAHGFHVDALPGDSVTNYALHRHAGAGERRAVGAATVPAPFGQHRIAVGRAAEQFGVEIARTVECLLPVAAQVFAAVHSAFGLRRQLDAHVGMEAVEQTVEIAAVAGVDQTVHHRGRSAVDSGRRGRCPRHEARWTMAGEYEDSARLISAQAGHDMFCAWGARSCVGALRFPVVSRKRVVAVGAPLAGVR